MEVAPLMIMSCCVLLFSELSLKIWVLDHVGTSLHRDAWKAGQLIDLTGAWVEAWAWRWLVTMRREVKVVEGVHHVKGKRIRKGQRWGRGLHSGRGGELTWHYSHARGSRIQKKAEVRAREGRGRRRGLLSRRRVWGGRSPSLGRQGPKAGEEKGEAER